MSIRKKKNYRPPDDEEGGWEDHNPQPAPPPPPSPGVPVPAASTLAASTFPLPPAGQPRSGGGYPDGGHGPTGADGGGGPRRTTAVAAAPAPAPAREAASPGAVALMEAAARRLEEAKSGGMGMGRSGAAAGAGANNVVVSALLPPRSTGDEEDEEKKASSSLDDDGGGGGDVISQRDLAMGALARYTRSGGGSSRSSSSRGRGGEEDEPAELATKREEEEEEQRSPVVAMTAGQRRPDRAARSAPSRTDHNRRTGNNNEEEEEEEGSSKVELICSFNSPPPTDGAARPGAGAEIGTGTRAGTAAGTEETAPQPRPSAAAAAAAAVFNGETAAAEEASLARVLRRGGRQRQSEQSSSAAAAEEAPLARVTRRGGRQRQSEQSSAAAAVCQEETAAAEKASLARVPKKGGRQRRGKQLLPKREYHHHQQIGGGTPTSRGGAVLDPEDATMDGKSAKEDGTSRGMAAAEEAPPGSLPGKGRRQLRGKQLRQPDKGGGAPTSRGGAALDLEADTTMNGKSVEGDGTSRGMEEDDRDEEMEAIDRDEGTKVEGKEDGHGDEAAKEEEVVSGSDGRRRKRKSIERYVTVHPPPSKQKKRMGQKVLDTSARKLVKATSAAAPVVSESGGKWQCHKCTLMNEPEKKRCTGCMSWKGGKRESFSPISKKKTKQSKAKSVAPSAQSKGKKGKMNPSRGARRTESYAFADQDSFDEEGYGGEELSAADFATLGLGGATNSAFAAATVPVHDGTNHLKAPAPRMRDKPRRKTNTCCGECEACMVDDCGECAACKDMHRFGGNDTKRRKCINRPPCMVLGGRSAESRSLQPDEPSTLEPSSRLRKRPPARALPSPLDSRVRPSQEPRYFAGGGVSSVSVTANVGGVPWPSRKTATIPLNAIDDGDDDDLLEPDVGKYSEPEPLPEAEALPPLPDTGLCKWSFDETSRVLLAKFERKSDAEIHCDDEDFLLRMMERDDITVISEGLVDDLDASLWHLGVISGSAGDEYYHKVRKFRRTVVEESKLVVGEEHRPDQPNPEQCYVTHEEVDGYVSMKVSDYVRYLEMRRVALERVAAKRKEAGFDPVNPTDADDDMFGRPTSTTANNSGDEGASDGNAAEDPGTSDIIVAEEEGLSAGNVAEKRGTSEEVSGGNVESDDCEEFEFVAPDGTTHSVNVVDNVLYLIDYDLVKLLPKLNADFVKKFRMPQCLPGGRLCMMNSVNVGGRPFMGPNFYVTPPASFTHFHQDGHGTVDSGHQCLSGYNEVVMLRRMPEEHKRRALHLLNGGNRRRGNSTMYDALYGLPHGDNLGDKPMWPDCEAIQSCKAMNYCPSVFILKPGQFVHINKGRLHAFRKMSPTLLPPSDCHAKLRSEVIKEHGLGSVEQLCISVAWDWMYTGVTSKGINDEIVSILDCARLNRVNGTQSLAIPETSILQMARTFASEYDRGSTSFLSNVQMLPFKSSPKPLRKILPSAVDVLKGILPSLEYVVNRHRSAFEAADEMKHFTDAKNRVSVCSKPNAWENPDLFALDPYGNDFFCKLCSEELSNIYMHCDGCEKILNKDFNICVSCHAEKKHACFVTMHPLNVKRHSTINHTGNMNYDRTSRCPCKNGPVCKNCGYCAGCSCRCHRWFTLHLRFMTLKDEMALLKRVQAAVGDDTLPVDSTLSDLNDSVVATMNALRQKRGAASTEQDFESNDTDSLERNGANDTHSLGKNGANDTPSQGRKRARAAISTEDYNAALESIGRTKTRKKRKTFRRGQYCKVVDCEKRSQGSANDGMCRKHWREVQEGKELTFQHSGPRGRNMGASEFAANEEDALTRDEAEPGQVVEGARREEPSSSARASQNAHDDLHKEGIGSSSLRAELTGDTRGIPRKKKKSRGKKKDMAANEEPLRNAEDDSPPKDEVTGPSSAGEAGSRLRARRGGRRGAQQGQKLLSSNDDTGESDAMDEPTPETTDPSRTGTGIDEISANEGSALRNCDGAQRDQPSSARASQNAHDDLHEQGIGPSSLRAEMTGITSSSPRKKSKSRREKLPPLCRALGCEKISESGKDGMCCSHFTDAQRKSDAINEPTSEITEPLTTTDVSISDMAANEELVRNVEDDSPPKDEFTGPSSALDAGSRSHTRRNGQQGQKLSSVNKDDNGKSDAMDEPAPEITEPSRMTGTGSNEIGADEELIHASQSTEDDSPPEDEVTGPSSALEAGSRSRGRSDGRTDVQEGQKLSYSTDDHGRSDSTDEPALETTEPSRTTGIGTETQESKKLPASNDGDHGNSPLADEPTPETIKFSADEVAENEERTQGFEEDESVGKGNDKPCHSVCASQSDKNFSPPEGEGDVSSALKADSAIVTSNATDPTPNAGSSSPHAPVDDAPTDSASVAGATETPVVSEKVHENRICPSTAGATSKLPVDPAATSNGPLRGDGIADSTMSEEVDVIAAASSDQAPGKSARAPVAEGMTTRSSSRLASSSSARKQPNYDEVMEAAATPTIRIWTSPAAKVLEAGTKTYKIDSRGYKRRLCKVNSCENFGNGLRNDHMCGAHWREAQAQESETTDPKVEKIATTPRRQASKGNIPLSPPIQFTPVDTVASQKSDSKVQGLECAVNGGFVQTPKSARKKKKVHGTNSQERKPARGTNNSRSAEYAALEDVGRTKKRKTSPKKVCKVDGCEKFEQGKRYDFMCRAHFREAQEGKLPCDSDEAGGTSNNNGANEPTPGTGEPPRTMDSSTSLDDVATSKAESVRKGLEDIDTKKKTSTKRKVCKVDGCEKLSRGKGFDFMCNAHFREEQEGKLPCDSNEAGGNNNGADESTPETSEPSRTMDTVTSPDDAATKEEGALKFVEAESVRKGFDEASKAFLNGANVRAIQTVENDSPPKDEGVGPSALPAEDAGSGTETRKESIAFNEAHQADDSANVTLNGIGPTLNASTGSLTPRAPVNDAPTDSTSLAGAKETPVVSNEQLEKQQCISPASATSNLPVNLAGTSIDPPRDGVVDSNQVGVTSAASSDQNHGQSSVVPIQESNSRPRRKSSKAFLNGANDNVDYMKRKPRSKEDVARGALAYTAPFADAKPIQKSSKINPALNCEMILRMFDDMEAYDDDDEPSVGICHRALPNNIGIDRDCVRHLYRNFHGETDVIKASMKSSLPISRREVDIIVYCIAEGKDAAFCHTFMPYRLLDGVKTIYKDVEGRGYHKNEKHVSHTRESLGELFRLEVQV